MYFMTTMNIPQIDLHQSKINQVVKDLEQYKKDFHKELRSRDFTMENGQVWTSWTMRETCYKKKADTFPTMARGIFTQGLANDQYQVMVRGYDKFFNVFETNATQWSSIVQETQGPYEVTSKENGCIIFIVALTSETIVVTSKHSMPEVKTNATAHAGVGYLWVLKHLDSVGKTEKDLAAWLFDKNVTLVAELCDDEFEQHILPYVEKDRGLYLHGINYNTVDLYTLPSSTVQHIAKEFGFHITLFDTFDTAEQLKEFEDTMKKTGTYRGKEVEGVVIRCKRKGKDFMFKIKNEKYLMFREYREITNAVLQFEKEIPVVKEEKAFKKIRYEKTRFYLDWIKKRVVDHPEWFTGYKENKGIIHVRQEFEAYWEQGELDK